VADTDRRILAADARCDAAEKLAAREQERARVADAALSRITVTMTDQSASIKKLEGVIEDITQKLKNAQTERAVAVTETKRLIGETTRLTAGLVAAEKAKGTTDAAAGQYTTIVSTLEQTVKTLQEESLSITMRWEDAKSQLERVKAEQIAAAQTHSAGIKEANAKVLALQARLQAAGDAACGNCASLNKQLAAVKSTLVETEGKLEATEGAVSSNRAALESELEATTKQLASLRREIEVMKGKLQTALSSEAEAARINLWSADTIKGHEEHITTLEKLLEGKKTTVETIRGAVKEREIAIEKLNAELESANERLNLSAASSQVELTSMSETLTKCKTQIVTFEQVIESKQSIIEERDTTIEKLNAELESTNEALESSAIRLAKHVQAQKALSAETLAKNKSMAELEAQMAAGAITSKQQEDRIQALEAELVQQQTAGARARLEVEGASWGSAEREDAVFMSFCLSASISALPLSHTHTYTIHSPGTVLLSHLHAQCAYHMYTAALRSRRSHPLQGTRVRLRCLHGRTRTATVCCRTAS